MGQFSQRVSTCTRPWPTLSVSHTNSGFPARKHKPWCSHPRTKLSRKVNASTCLQPSGQPVDFIAVMALSERTAQPDPFNLKRTNTTRIPKQSTSKAKEDTQVPTFRTPQPRPNRTSPIAKSGTVSNRACCSICSQTQDTFWL